MLSVITLLFMIVARACADETLEEYTANWYTNIANTGNYTRPTSNIEFKDIPETDCVDYGSFDFVIVGGGTAGCVLANRLTDIKKWRVLVIEAGDNETDFSRIPAARYPITNTDINWGYLTVPQKNACQGMINKQCSYNRGKILGGMSSMDLMMNIRGHKHDFNDWEQMGNPGWGYEDVLPYFIKADNATLIEGDEGYHGYSGPWRTAYPQPTNPLQSNILDSNKQIGLQEIDYNGENQLGIGRTQFNMYRGLRLSTNTAYLQPVLNRKNLVVLKNALATNIKFHNNIARSVTFLHSKQCKRVHVKKEVLLTAGAVNNVQLLMLSGIGPQNELMKLGIKVVKNLPVGQNLMDHLAFYGMPILNNKTIQRPTTNESLKNLKEKGEGLLTYSDGMELAFYRLLNKTDPSVPDSVIMYFYDSASYYGFNYVGIENNYDEELTINGPGLPPGTLQPYYILLHPKSIGNITLQSKDPTEFPLINPNYLAHPDDIETIYLAIKKQQELLTTPPMQQINATFGKVPTSACNNLLGDDRQFWYCIIRQMTHSMQNPTGVCSMGSDVKTSVVGKTLLVHGIKNLRVIGGSVAPKIPSGHASTVAVMMGEKLSEFIKNHYTK